MVFVAVDTLLMKRLWMVKSFKIGYIGFKGYKETQIYAAELREKSVKFMWELIDKSNCLVVLH